MKKTKETRSFQAELRSDEDSRLISGYALKFNSLSHDLGGFVEKIHPDSLTGILEKSDILALLNHDQSRGVLARSKRGTGSLKLGIDEIGLRYEFEAPKTALGEEVLEGIRRGEICTSSFAFRIEQDSWTKLEDGTYIREILKFAELYDVSPVWREAYPETDVAIRSLEEFRAKEEIEEETTEEVVEEIEEETTTEEEVVEIEEEETTEEEVVNKSEIKRSMKNFSLIKTLRNNGKNLSEEAKAVLSQGRSEMRAAGLACTDGIVLPLETRDIQVAEGLGIEAVSVEKFDILSPLRANLVLAQAGATFLTGLQGDVSIPAYSGSSVGWANEVATAMSGAGSFTDVVLKPKRITAVLDISKRFLLQDSVGAEEMLKADIVKAISNKLEATILSADAGTDVKPAGIFNGVVAETSAINYKGLVAMESALEDANVTGQVKMIVSPSAKAELKTTLKATGASAFLMEGNEANGYEVLSTSAVTGKGVLMGNFEDLVIAQWGAIELTVDEVSQAHNGKIRLIVNAYMDAAPRRKDAFVAKILK